MRKSDKQLNECPTCKRANKLGRISKSEFFCGNCLIEIKVVGKTPFILDVDNDGNVRGYKNILLEVI